MSAALLSQSSSVKSRLMHQRIEYPNMLAGIATIPYTHRGIKVMKLHIVRTAPARRVNAADRTGSTVFTI